METTSGPMLLGEAACKPDFSWLPFEAEIMPDIFCPRTSFNLLVCLIESNLTVKWPSFWLPNLFAWVSLWVNVENRMGSLLSACSNGRSRLMFFHGPFWPISSPCPDVWEAIQSVSDPKWLCKDPAAWIQELWSCGNVVFWGQSEIGKVQGHSFVTLPLTGFPSLKQAQLLVLPASPLGPSTPVEVIAVNEPKSQLRSGWIISLSEQPWNGKCDMSAGCLFQCQAVPCWLRCSVLCFSQADTLLVWGRRARQMLQN